LLRFYNKQILILKPKNKKMKKLLFVGLCILLFGIQNKVNAQFTNFTAANSDLPSDYVMGGIDIDTNNNVWVGTDAGVAKFDGTAWTVYTTTDGLPSDIISCVAVDPLTNKIWVGTQGDGVACFNGSAWTSYNFNDGLCDNGIYNIAIDHSGVVWFGSWGAGISKFDGTTWTNYDAADGFPEDQGALASVYYIHVDAANNKWFGSDLGLIKYDNSAFSLINQTSMPNLLNNYIMAINTDDDGNKWLGVQYSGLAKINSSDTWAANYDTAHGICDNGITDIKINSLGDIWLGAYTQYGALVRGGITKFNPITGTGISFSESDGLVNNKVSRIALDKDDALWIATGGGVSKYDDHSAINELENTRILDVYPNPVAGIININGDIDSGIATICDITGKVVLTQQVSSGMVINTAQLKAGVYFIQITEKETVYTGKFIVR